MRTLRNFRLVQVITLITALSLFWLQIGPVLAGTAIQSRHDRQEMRLRLEAARRASKLAPGLTQTPDAALRRKIAIREKAAQEAAMKPVADVRPLSPNEMTRARGRGPFRNPYLAGSPMPWQRAFRDVNLCDGNLFKSFTDLQVAPARGAGLVLQRTYNSNDARVGPFGVGWTHAYDIRIQEATAVQTESGNPSAVSVQPVSGSAQPGGSDTVNEVPRTDFFGAKHTYHRDADGLYSPPAYLYDEMNSNYDTSLANGPAKVEDDTEKGMDGTVKHYVNVLTLADGTEGNERACDYIQDRYGNRTTLTYGQSYVQPDGSTRKILTQVTDPTGRSLAFTWTNLGTTAQPAYRITQTQGPLVGGSAVSGVTETVAYAYYTDPTEANAANDLFNLKSVTLDAGDNSHLNRTMTYTYTGVSGTYYDQGGNPQTGSDNGLLTSISDPLGHTLSYQYGTSRNYGGGASIALLIPNSVWVMQITEPGGAGPHSWLLADAERSSSGGRGVFIDANTPGLTNGYSNSWTNNGFGVDTDPQLRVTSENTGDGHGDDNYNYAYDSDNNVTLYNGGDLDGGENAQLSLYGQHGNLLTQNAAYDGYNSSGGYGLIPWPHGTANTYYNASQYFQKQSTTDALGHTTMMGVGADTAGTAGDPDPNLGDRGQVLWVQDAGYNDSASPSYHKQYAYTYNRYGQKTSETNLNGVVTAYYYGGDGSPYANADTNPYDLGDLIAVVQDPGGAGHLNRTTTMRYDALGRVLQSTDPLGQVSAFVYNMLGQPVSVSTPAKGATPAETISYLYDTNGRTLSVQDSRRTTTMAYVPGTDFVQSITDSITGTTSYTYGPWGERLTMTLPGGGTWTYSYDPTTQGPPDLYANGGSRWYVFPDPTDFNSIRRTCTRITDDQGRRVDYGYTDAGKITGALANQVFSTTRYTSAVSSSLTQYAYARTWSNNNWNNGNVPPWVPQGQLAALATTWSGPGVGMVSGQPRPVTRCLSQSAYTYDDDSQRLTNTVSTQPIDPATGNPQVDGNQNPILTSRQESYGYDALNRLKSVDYGDGQTQGYSFDAMGNRAQKTDSAAGTTSYTVDAANRLTSTNGQAVTSDADGNTLTDGTRTNVWDSQNRLVSCTKGGTTSTYTYGADGLRRSSTVNGVTTYYVYDGQMMVREMKQNAQGVLQSTATYLCGPRGPEYRRDDTQAEGTYTDGTGTQQPAGKTRWYVYDGLGSVVGEVDPSGNLTSTGTFDVYGAKRQGGTGTASSRQGFVGSLGHVTDSETGLVYMRARYYDPNVGRFVSEDPKCSGVNWFNYCDNNPTSRVDESGKSSDVLEAVGVLSFIGAEVLTIWAFTAFFEKNYSVAIAACNAAAVAWGAAFLAPSVQSRDHGLVEIISGGLAGGLTSAVMEIAAYISGNAALATACPGGYATVAIVALTVEGVATIIAADTIT